MDQQDMKKILIVDDEIDFVFLLKKRLEARRYKVVTAYEGEGVKELAKQENVDLIILDLLLPDVNGSEVCLRLKRNGTCASIPIIICSAHAQEDTIKQSKEWGAEAFITKPIDPKFLLGKIEELLEQSTN